MEAEVLVAGKERLRVKSAQLYRGAVGALLVYDVAERVTFESCARWLEELRNNAHPDIGIMLVGNKKGNLPAERRQVSFDSAEGWARQNELLFAEVELVLSSDGVSYCTSLRCSNVSDIFERLIQEIHKKIWLATSTKTKIVA